MKDHVETLTNMLSGMLINYVLTLMLFGVSTGKALGTTCIFFICSYIRSYCVRRYFRKLEENRNKE